MGNSLLRLFEVLRDFSNMMAKMGAIFVLHSLSTLPRISSGLLVLLV